MKSFLQGVQSVRFQKKLRGAILGYGFIASAGHLPAYLKREKEYGDLQIVAVADPTRARLERVGEVLPEAELYQAAEDLLANEALSLDFVDICAPPHVHASLAHLALDRGLHVLCEKPLTTNSHDAWELIQKAKRVRKVLLPCHNYQFAPVIQEIQQVICSGMIGRVRSVSLNTYRNTHAKGVLEWNTHWRRDPALSGGGIAMDHGSHSFYLAFDWLGGYPNAVTAKMSTFDQRFLGSEDQFLATLSFPQGIAQVCMSWTAGVRKVIYSIQGELGALTVDDDELQLARMIRTDGVEVAQGAVRWEVDRKTISSQWMDASHVHWFGQLLGRFVRAIDEDEYVGKDTMDAFFCVQTIQQAYRSAREGCRELSLPSRVESQARGELDYESSQIR